MSVFQAIKWKNLDKKLKNIPKSKNNQKQDIGTRWGMVPPL